MKKQMIAGFMILALIGMITGCGKENTGNAGLEMETEGQIEVVEETVETGRIEEEETSEGETETSKKEKEALEEETEISNGEADSREKSGVPEAEAGSGIEGMELSDSGNVKEITEEYITVALAYEKEDENGVLMISSNSETDGENVKKVYYTDKTIFKILEVRNAGIDPEKDVTEKEASIKDLKKESSIQIVGSWDSNGCQADIIYIYQFI